MHAAMTTRAARNILQEDATLHVSAASSRLGDFEAVARSAYRLQVARLVRILLNFLTNTAHIDVDRAAVSRSGYRATRRRAIGRGVKTRPGWRGKIFQQPKFGSRGLGKLTADHQGHAAAVDFDVAGFRRSRAPDGRSKRRSTARTRATSSRGLKGLGM